MPDEPSLASIIIAQSAETIGVPVMLFTEATLDGDPTDDDQPPGPVERLMVRLGMEPGGVELFGTDAYLLQTALGVDLLPDER